MRFGLLACTVGALTLLPSVASAQCEAGPRVAMTDLVRMGRSQLLALYGSSEAGNVPQGYVAGRGFDPSRPLAPARSWLLSRTLWQGKLFLDDSHMVNVVMRKERVPGAVYVAESWYDGRPAIIIDYTGSWWYAERYRDEFRELCPGVYLGLTYKRCPQKVVMFFALDARCGGR